MLPVWLLLSIVGVSAGDSWKPIHVKTKAGNIMGRLGGGSLNDHCAFDPFHGSRSGSPDVATFYGIPYAQAPTGALRFAPPQPRLSWAPKSLDATKIPPICPQVPAVAHPSWTPHWVPGYSREEDCLTLNVWTRAPFSSSHDDARPVFAWIHGGGFIGGNGYQEFGCSFYDGNVMTADGGLVMVSMNYRLGFFGFLDLPELRLEAGTAGNYGIQDQRLALKWIQANIATFGGDPSQVTIVGESAGAVSVLHHMVLPRSQGLFSRAVAESAYINPGAENWRPQVRGARFVREVVRSAKCSGEPVLECLRNASVDTLLNAQDGTQHEYFAGALDYYPVADGYELPANETILTAFAKVESTKLVPLIIGSNFNETSLFQCSQLKENIGQEEAVRVMQDVVYVLTYDNITAEAAERLLAKYPVGQGNFQSSRDAVIGAVTDIMFTCPTHDLAHSVASLASNTVYRYMLGRSPKFFRMSSSCLGVPHIADTFYVFYNDVIGRVMDEGDKTVAHAMMAAWTAFAKGGEPVLPANFSNTAWPKWDNTEENTFLFDESPGMLSKFHNPGCDVVREVLPQSRSALRENLLVV